MDLRSLLATAWAVAALYAFAACGDGGEPAEEIPDEAVQSDEAAPLETAGEDTVFDPD